MNKFEKSFNYDNSFIRKMVLGVISEMHRKIRWTNVWEDKEKLVTLPIYYGFGSDERYLLDAFVDDVIGKRPELNRDPVPRGNIIINNSVIKRDEYSNPNVYLTYYKEEDGIMKKMKSKRRNLPVKTTIDIELKMKTEIDLLKCQESLWDWFLGYKYFYIDHEGMRIDCTMEFPDDYPQEINRENEKPIGGNNDTMKFIKFSIDVNSTYPLPLKEQKPIYPTTNKALYLGNIRTLGDIPERKFIGGNVNKKKK
jgi:hypothetical protein